MLYAGYVFLALLGFYIGSMIESVQDIVDIKTYSILVGALPMAAAWQLARTTLTKVSEVEALDGMSREEQRRLLSIVSQLKNELRYGIFYVVLASACAGLMIGLTIFKEQGFSLFFSGIFVSFLMLFRVLVHYENDVSNFTKIIKRRKEEREKKKLLLDELSVKDDDKK